MVEDEEPEVLLLQGPTNDSTETSADEIAE
jgi:hypothetical protein